MLTLSCEDRLQESPCFLGILVPGVLPSGTCGIFTDARAKFRVFIKPPHQRTQRHDIARIDEHETVHTFGDDLGSPVIDTGDDRKSASHCFQRWQSEGILERGANIGVSYRVKREGIRAEMRPAAAIEYAEVLGKNLIRAQSVLACDKKTNWEICARGHGFKNSRKPFDAPVVADEQENEIILLKVVAEASLSVEPATVAVWIVVLVCTIWPYSSWTIRPTK